MQAEKRGSRRSRSEEEFASALARALGPIYKVSILDEAGRVDVSFGGFVGKGSEGTVIPLPGSERSLLLEVDDRSIAATMRTLQAMIPPSSGGDVASGTFTHIDRALDELIALAEAQVGKPLSEMTRAEKQSVVRFLADRGAFAVRKSVETVAEALGVSRFTVYNYLESMRED